MTSDLKQISPAQEVEDIAQTEEEVYLIPVSFAQQRLWFLDELMPGNALYNIPAPVRLRGKLDVEALEASLQEIVFRHEVLRTTFEMVDGELMQVITLDKSVPLTQISLHDVEESEQEQRVMELALEDAQTPFDLARGPLLRTTLLSLDEEDHVLLLTMHHIVSDGWSMSVLVGEMVALYSAFVAGKESPLPDLPLQYADFSEWQQEWLQGETLDQHLDYWTKKLTGHPSVLQLPTDRPRPAVQTNRGDNFRFTLGKPMLDGLAKLSRQAGTTQFMTLLTAFKTLLYRYTGQEDIVVGTPIAGRNQEEIEGLIGFFVNTLVLRTELKGEQSFREVMENVRQHTLSAYAHQDVPFEKIVEKLQPERSMSYSPLFQVMFILQNTPPMNVELPGLTLSPLELNLGAAKFDLSLELSETAEGLRGTVEYNVDLFDRATIERMVQHFEALLAEVVADPNRALSELPLLSTAEREQLLGEWSGTVTEYPKHLSINQLFEQQAEQTPDRVAVVYENELLTYSELNSRANQLARHLQQLGVGSDVLVGISVERSLEMIVGLLAIVKAGGAYVPLDPSYPQERLTYMLQDTKASVLLTTQHLQDKLPAHDARVVLLDGDSAQIAEHSTGNLPNVATAESLAYINYTSGSTGQPKGVCIPHRAVVRLVKNTNYLDISADDVFLQFATISFDAATLEIWGSLLNGAQLVVFPAGQPSLQELGQVLRRHQVTILWLTAGLFHQMVDNHLSDLASVRQLLAGGDVLSVAHVKKVLRALPNCRMINGYGPTENTTFTCCNPMDDESQVGSTVSIGRPIANTQVYIVDRQLQPVPVGVPGELLTGGDGLALGYLNQPELTAEKFVKNPFSDDENARLYRTGDLARFLPDGTIEFMGRIDNQVKVRGFRIELGEIEAVLAQHPSVQENIVIVREDVPGDKRIVGYLVSSEPEVTSELRQHLRDSLPEYMVPSDLVVLDELPLTANGKVDRRALPAPDRSQMRDKQFIAPRTEIEQVVADIWGEILRIESVSVNDNFFDLGGHSLLATQMVTRASAALETEFSLRVLFESPVLADFAQRIEEKKRGAEGSQSAPITKLERGDAIALSFAQERLWFLEQYAPGNVAYNIPVAIRLTGTLDLAALEDSFNALIRRHETLRTTFVTKNGQPTQEIHPPSAIELTVTDLQEVPQAEREAKLLSLAVEEASRAFDLTRDRLLRVALLRLHEQEHVLLLTMHHIVSDGWSMTVLVQELAALYEAFHSGKQALLPELPVQYADFASWQKDWLLGGVLEQQLGYWRNQLGGELPVLQLPTDYPRPAVHTVQGSSQSVVLPKQLLDSLKALSQQKGVTLFMTLISAYKTLLYRYTKQEDLLVGTPIANRTRTEIENLIGFFVNTLVMRSNVSAEMTFDQLLGQVREMSLEAYANQDVPFEKLVEELQPKRDLSYTPIFQVMFVLQNNTMAEVELSGLTMAPLEMENVASKFDLTLTMFEQEDGLLSTLTYNTNLFAAETIERMLTHLQTLLEGIAATPEQRLADLPLLQAAEREQVLTEWSTVTADYPLDLTLPELLDRQAEQTPDRIAVTFGEESLTYRALNERANQVAHRLQKMGVGRDVLVGIYMERSLEMIVGLLGILKAGGAYVPLDPANPPERIAYMLQDAQAPVLLTQEHLLDLLPAHVAVTLCLDAAGKNTADELTTPVPHTVSADDLAYVMYTSGSTGQPKGVMLPQRAVVNRLFWMQETYGLTETDRILQKTPLTFDVSVWEVFWPLITGARLIVAQPDGHKDPAYLVKTISEQGISLIHFIPSMLQLILEEKGLAGCTSLRHVFSGGEALSVELQDRFFERLNVPLHNRYGPTEITINATWFNCEREVKRSSVPIGRPLANTDIYVLDEKMEPVPIGVPGELHVGGVSLARGYLNRDDLTAEKFVPHPFSAEQGARLYKTGDLVRYLADGNIEFLGRIDDQVKIRGIRIELGEIENVLLGHTAVRGAVVLVREDAAGYPQLVAYVVPVAGQEVAPESLRVFLKEELPEYMVPSAFVVLEEIPLTPNGKVDRRALPMPDYAEWSAGKEFVLPRNHLEEMVAQVFGEVLRMPQVSIHDNFFDLGGHSLLAVKVMSRIGSAFQVEMPLRTLFEAPTVAEFAAHVAKAQQAANGVVIPPIVPVERVGRLPLSFAQERLWFLDQLQPGSPAYNMPSAVRINGRLNRSALERTFAEMIRRHESLRTTFAQQGGTPQQVVRPHADFHLSLIDLRDVPAEEREQRVLELAGEESARPFSISTDLLVRGTLLQLAEEEHVLLLTMHHIVSDGWSMRVFTGELTALYDAFVAGQESPLEDLSVQYADFAHWQRQWLQGDVLEAQLGYWRKQLGGELPQLQLPTDHPRPAVQTLGGSTASIRLPKHMLASLRELSRQEGATLYMTLLSAFKSLIYRYTGQEDLLVGTPIAGRTRAEVQNLIGFFVNTLVIRTDLSGNPSFRDLLGQVRETALEAYANQDVSFEKLVEELQPSRNMGTTPFFQVLFALNQDSSQVMEFSGLTMRPLAVEQTTAKFDLSLHMTETDQDELIGLFEYNTDLFEAATIERMLGHLQILLEAIIESPEQSISDLPLLSDDERETMLVAWNETATDAPRESSIAELFEQYAEQTPDRTAVVYENERLTYSELNRRANQLAWHLKEQGVDNGVLVAISMERSVELIVGLLAIVKAGGAYVPLDPSYPQDRLSYMLQDTGAPVLLTTEHLQEKLPQHEAKVVLLDTDAERIALQNEDNPPSAATPESVAYVNYTSGSTGKPKGVLLPHRGVVRLVKNANYMDVSADDVFLQYSTVSFDAATFEIWGGLLNGAQLVVFPAGQASLHELGQVVRRHQVTILFLTAGLFHQMVDNHLDDLGSVRYLLSGGDVLSVAHVKQVLRALPGCKMVNAYGPTENTSFTTCNTMDEENQVGNTVSIGRPIANTQVYIVDPHLNPVPIGVAGELLTGGDGLALGYLNQPEMTAEKFVRNPFVEDQNARLYRTGDMARFLPDGRLEFMGRIDNQVKVRGFRIELGEIEAVLAQHPSVQENIVIVREDVPGDKRIVAYVVAEEIEGTSELRQFLRDNLPDYMVPSNFVVLSELPLTLNGKIDRKALPAPDRAALKREDEFIAPRTEAERVVAEIWANVLHVEAVSVTDNFFDLGGHSLLATRVISQASADLQIDITLRTLFESPVLADFAQRIEAEQQSARVEHSEIVVAENRDGLPLSFAQERLWLLDQLGVDSHVYNVPFAVRLRGQLDVQALEQSFRAIALRHEALRTAFAEVEGQPVQIMTQGADVELSLIDLSNLAPEEREAETLRLAASEAKTPFDLKTGPLLRTSLVRLDEQEHVLLLTIHHIVSDGWSLGVLMSELSAHYTAFQSGQAQAQLPELPVQYADYANWQRQWLQGDVLEQQLDYWKEQLGGHLAVLQLPTDRPRPAVQTYNGDRYSMCLSKPLTDALKKRSQEAGTTLFMTLLAGFQTLLYRYTGQEDILIGTPIAGRTRREVENLIGFFVNTLVMRGHLSAEMMFTDLLQQVRETALGAYAHQDVPFEKLVNALQPERNMSYSPLFQVMFALQNAPMDAALLPGLTLTQVEIENKTAKFDLNFSMSETGEGLFGTIEYNTDLFDASTIARMMKHFETLLTAVAHDPGQTLSELPVLTEEDKHQLLVEWNPHQDYTWESTRIHQRFEEMAARFPDRVAAVCEDEQVTYRELNQRANRLAHYLQGLGVEPDTLVGLSVERDLGMVVAVLGILKAGGAYVPLDPTYPADRLAFMVEDSQMPIVLTEQHLLDTLPEHNAQVVLLDGDADRIAEQSSENPISKVTEDNLAYVIYTSGSTGKPKGVLINHSNVIRLFAATDEWYHFNEEDVWTVFHSYAFDFSVWELWGALFYGGRLVVVPYLTSRSPQAFYELLCREGVTVLNQTPSAFRQLIWAEETLGVSSELSLRYVIFGGEALELNSLQPWFDRHGDQRPQLVNMYGITETTVHVTYRPINQIDLESGVGSVIGQPIPDLQVYLLDQHRQPVPIGVTGEMYVGGSGVARGYLNRAELTEERFIENPFGTHGGGRLYKSGDLARFLPNGDLEYQGRIDHQVKIRGFRIELGEIEAVLGQHPEVRETAVLAREDAPGDKRLVAYLVVKGETEIGPAELRRYLGEHLPDYMIPSAFVVLESFPLTGNGKVDTRALPAPNEQSIDRTETFVAPRDNVEMQVMQIWEAELGIRTSVRDNFFSIGGNSLLAVRIMARIEKQFGQKLPLATLFQEGTIEHLAAILRQEGSQEATPLVAIQSAGTKRPLFLVHPIGGSVFSYSELSRALGTDQPVYGLQTVGLDHDVELDTRVEQMATRYLAEIQSVQPEGPYQIGGWSFGGLVAFEMAKQLEQRGEEVALLALIDSEAPTADVKDDGKMEEAMLLHGFVIDFTAQLGIDIAIFSDLIGQVPTAEVLNAMIEHARKEQLIPPGTGLPELQRLFNVYAVNRRANHAYLPDSYAKSAVLFRATNNPHYEADPAFGWNQLVQGELKIFEVPAHHFNIVEAPYVQMLAEQLADCLEEAATDSKVKN